MCKFCDVNILEALAINNKDEAVIINQDVETKEYFIDGLEERIYIDYCPMCRKEVRGVNEEEIRERIELLRKISKEIYDNEFYIETAILSYQAQEEKTYTFFRDDEQKDELRKYSWCQRPDSTNMSLKRFTENGEIEGYMSESLAEHYGLRKVDLNEFIHKFVKPLVKYKLGLEEESYDK